MLLLCPHVEVLTGPSLHTYFTVRACEHACEVFDLVLLCTVCIARACCSCIAWHQPCVCGCHLRRPSAAAHAAAVVVPTGPPGSHRTHRDRPSSLLLDGCKPSSATSSWQLMQAALQPPGPGSTPSSSGSSQQGMQFSSSVQLRCGTHLAAVNCAAEQSALGEPLSYSAGVHRVGITS